MKLPCLLPSADSILQAEIQIDWILADVVQKHWEDQTMKHLTSYLASWSTLFGPLLVAPHHDTSPAAAFENSDNDIIEPVRI